MRQENGHFSFITLILKDRVLEVHPHCSWQKTHRVQIGTCVILMDSEGPQGQ